jgi:hypothetical protein
MFYFGEHGWGRLTFEFPPPTRTTVLMVTPWYSDATSRSRIGWAEPLLGYPIVPRTSPLVPDVVDGYREGCRYIDRRTDRLAGYDDGPCEHRNKWARGPQNGFSYCIYKRCQTTGHAPQGGWSTFLAHSELWARIEMVTPPPVIGFVACGASCDDSTTGSTQPPASTSTVPPPGSTPPTSGDDIDPCTLPGVDCDRQVCDASGTCAPRCGDAPCPPPSPCDLEPDAAPCRTGPFDGVSARVVLAAPEVFVARGVLEPQSVRVVEVSLRCGARLCRTEDGLDPSSLEVTGVLELASLSTGYRICPTGSTGTATNCTFRITATDADPLVRVGDRVTAVFYTPTRTGEWLAVTLDGPTATVEGVARLPVLAWERRGGEFVLVDTGETAWQATSRVAIPVEVVTFDGQVVPDDGLRRLVIGTTGRN